VQFDSRAICKIKGLGFGPFTDYHDMLTPHTLCGGYGKRTDNIDWIFNKDVVLDKGRTNEYGLEDAFAYFKKSFDGNETERKKYQAKFFVTLGFMSHMLQDLHSPAHVRDGSHITGDYLEIYGRYDKGFNLRQGNMNPTNEQEIKDAIATFNMANYLNGMNFKSLEDFYYKEALWVSHNFFSEEHNKFESSNIETGFALSVNNVFDRDTIFDNYNDHLSKDETYEVDETDSTGNWSYIKTNGNAISTIYGDIVEGHDTVAFNNKGFLFTSLDDNEHMIKAKYTLEYDASLDEYRMDQYTEADKTPLKDTAVNVIPRAVASTQAFLNFFFRGQIAVSTIYTRRIYIFNDSNTSSVTDNALLTFKASGEMYVYYMNDDNVTHSIRKDDEGNPEPYLLVNDLLVNSQTSFDLNEGSNGVDRFAGKNIDGQTRWIVIFDGNIGNEGGGSNTYKYGMRSMTADVALDRFKRVEREDDNDTVIDYQRGVEWQDTSYTWVTAYWDAERYCNNLTLGGYTNWGLPSVNDLESIIRPMAYDEDGSPLRTDAYRYIYRKYFKHLGTVGYWSAGVNDNYPQANTATVINYSNGSSSSINIDYQMNVRCVRSTY
jgi:hypothetical protein